MNLGGTKAYGLCKDMHKGELKKNKRISPSGKDKTAFLVDQMKYDMGCSF